MSVQKASLYRNYTSWLMASEPRYSIARLPRVQFRRLAFWLLIAMLFFSFILWQRMQVVKLGYEVAKMRKTRDELAYTHAQLQHRLMEISSLPYAEEVARKQLGMSNVELKQVVYLKGDEKPGSGLWRRLGKLFSH